MGSVVHNTTAFGGRREPLEVSVQPEHTRFSNVRSVQKKRALNKKKGKQAVEEMASG